MNSVVVVVAVVVVVVLKSSASSVVVVLKSSASSVVVVAVKSLESSGYTILLERISFETRLPNFQLNNNIYVYVKVFLNTVEAA